MKQKTIVSLIRDCSVINNVSVAKLLGICKASLHKRKSDKRLDLSLLLPHFKEIQREIALFEKTRKLVHIKNICKLKLLKYNTICNQLNVWPVNQDSYIVDVNNLIGVEFFGELNEIVRRLEKLD